MKKIILILTVVFLSSCATNTSFNSFYQKHQKDSDMSFGMNASIVRAFLDDDDIEELKPLLKRAKHVRILMFEENAQAMSSKFDHFIKRSKFDGLIQLNDSGDQINLYSIDQKEKIKEIVVEVNSGDELILLGLKTNISHQDLQKLFKDNDISMN